MVLAFLLPKNTTIHKWWLSRSSSQLMRIFSAPLSSKLNYMDVESGVDDAELAASNAYQNCALHRDVDIYKGTHEPVFEDDVDGIIYNTFECELTINDRSRDLRHRTIRTTDGMIMRMTTCTASPLDVQHHVETFYTDLYHAIDECNVNAAIFIALHAEAIPNHGPGNCRVKVLKWNGKLIPVVFLARGGAPELVLTFKLLNGFYLTNRLKKNENTPSYSGSVEPDAEVIRTHISPIFSDVRELEIQSRNRVCTAKISLAREIQDHECVSAILSCVRKLEEKMPWLVTQPQKALDVSAGIVTNYLDRKGHWPKSSDLSLTQRECIKFAGGLKVVLAHAKAARNEAT